MLTMVQNKNAETLKLLIRAGSLKMTDEFPNQIQNSFFPTIETNPSLVRQSDHIESGGTSTTGTVTFVSARPGFRFIIKNMNFSMTKDATCDLATGNYGFTVTTDESSSQVLCNVSAITLTASSMSVNADFGAGLRCKENTSISTGATFSAGTCVRSGSVVGYWEEVSKN